MAELSNLKNKIEIPATASILKGLKMYFYWEEAPRNSENKLGNTTELDWELWVEKIPAEIDEDLDKVYFNTKLKVQDEDFYVEDIAFFRIKNTNNFEKIGDSTTRKRITLTHDDNGNCEDVFEFYSNSLYDTYGSPTLDGIPKDESYKASVPFTLSPIPRIGYLYEMEDNYYDEDEDIPIFYRIVGDTGNVAKLEACISITGADDDVPYREVFANTTTGEGSYTFEITPEERIALYQANATSRLGKARVYLRTTLIDDTVYWDYVDMGHKLLGDYKPSIAPTVKDINPATLAVTGDENVFVKYVSQAYFETGAEVRKGASIAELVVDNITQSASGELTGTIDEVESGTFTFTLTDTRKDTVEEVIEKSLIEYFKPTCNQKISIAFSGGQDAVATVAISGTFFNQSFGAANNTIAVFIRHTLNDGSMSDWINVNSFFAEVNTEGNSYSVNFGMSNLDYDRLYTFQSKVVDSLVEEESAEYVSRSTPVFDWSKEDFNFNVPVSIKGGKVAGTYILFDDEATNEDITLNDSIANYEFIEIFYTDNNGKTFGSTKIPTAGITSTLTVTLSLIEPNYDPRSVGGAVTNITHKLNIRATTYFIQGNKINLSEQQGLLYIYENVYASSRSSNMRFDTEANYINITKVLGYK